MFLITITSLPPGRYTGKQAESHSGIVSLFRPLNMYNCVTACNALCKILCNLQPFSQFPPFSTVPNREIEL